MEACECSVHPPEVIGIVIAGILRAHYVESIGEDDQVVRPYAMEILRETWRDCTQLQTGGASQTHIIHTYAIVPIHTDTIESATLGLGKVKT